MSRRQNKKSPPTLKSRAFVNRPLFRVSGRQSPFRKQQIAVIERRLRKQDFSNLRKTIHRSPIAKKLHTLKPHLLQQVNRCVSKYSRILSWRADQKQSGGRNRAPRSQREKSSSKAKIFKHCN